MDLSVDSASYDNDQQVVYTLVLTNESDRSIHDFDVKDELLDILTTDDEGNEVNAFTQASIQAEATLLSSPGTYDRFGNLEATDVHITAGGSVTYTMTAKVSGDAAGTIDNVASASAGPLSSAESSAACRYQKVQRSVAGLHCW